MAVGYWLLAVGRERENSLDFQEFIGLYLRLLENCPQRALRHIAGVIGYCGVTPAGGIKPDFVAARCMAAKFKPEQSQPANNFPITVARQASQIRLPRQP